MKTEKKKKQLHEGRRHAFHNTYQGNKYSFSVGELGGICIPNMNTVSPRVNKKLKRQVERWGERYVRTDKQT